MLRPPTTDGVLSNHERRLYDLERQRPTTSRAAAVSAGGCAGHIIGFAVPEVGGLAPFASSGFVYVGFDDTAVTTIELHCDYAIDFTLAGQTFNATAGDNTFTPPTAITGNLGDRWAWDLTTNDDDWHGALVIHGACGYQSTNLFGGS